MLMISGISSTEKKIKIIALWPLLPDCGELVAPGYTWQGTCLTRVPVSQGVSPPCHLRLVAGRGVLLATDHFRIFLFVFAEHLCYSHQGLDRIKLPADID
jgi:hypothetical protein